MYVWSDVRTEFPPCVLQDIVPYRVRCPKRREEGSRRKKEEQEKVGKEVILTEKWKDWKEEKGDGKEMEEGQERKSERK